MQRGDGLSLIDGTHRMAAFVMFQELTDAQLAEMKVKRPSLEQDVWRVFIARGNSRTGSPTGAEPGNPIGMRDTSSNNQ